VGECRDQKQKGQYEVLRGGGGGKKTVGAQPVQTQASDHRRNEILTGNESSLLGKAG